MDKEVQDYMDKKVPFSACGELYQSIPGQSERFTRNLNDRWEAYQIQPADLKDSLIVDIGCNIGGFSVYCKDLCKSYLGIDTDAESIKLAKHLFPFPNCSFKTMSFHELKGSFNIIFAFAVKRYTGLSFEEFSRACHKLLIGKGKMFFESHSKEKLLPKHRKEFEMYFNIKRIIQVPAISYSDCDFFRYFIELERK